MIKCENLQIDDTQIFSVRVLFHSAMSVSDVMCIQSETATIFGAICAFFMAAISVDELDIRPNGELARFAELGRMKKVPRMPSE